MFLNLNKKPRKVLEPWVIPEHLLTVIQPSLNLLGNKRNMGPHLKKEIFLFLLFP